jgi:hypothetical protein
MLHYPVNPMQCQSCARHQKNLSPYRSCLLHNPQSVLNRARYHLNLKSGYYSQARRKRFADDTDAMDERGSNAGLIEKIHAMCPIRAAVSAVLQLRSSGFQNVSRLQHWNTLFTTKRRRARCRWAERQVLRHLRYCVVSNCPNVVCFDLDCAPFGGQSSRPPI